MILWILIEDWWMPMNLRTVGEKMARVVWVISSHMVENTDK